jgi:triosephosphate isomerase
MGRAFFVGGNWKNNGSVKSTEELVKTLNDAKLDSSVEVVVAPTFVHIPSVKAALGNNISVAAQNCWVKGSGAYTGEVSADILADLALKWVILGHSERRALLKESSEFVAEKTSYALGKGLSVILCCGETLEEREADKTTAVVVEQLSAVAEKVKDWSKVVIAYEPVWAIGTGKVASPQQAEDVHAEIRKWLSSSVSDSAAQATRIIYGGSVSAKNCKELAQQSNIDGFLVGGASLKPEFVEVINAKA